MLWDFNKLHLSTALGFEFAMDDASHCFFMFEKIIISACGKKSQKPDIGSTMQPIMVNSRMK